MWPVDLARQGGATAFFYEEGLVARKRGHTGGGAIAFLWWAVLSARRPVLCLKICGLKTLLDRGAITLFKCFALYCER